MTTERYELAEGYMEFAPEDGKWVHWSDYSKMRSSHLVEVHSLKSRIAGLEKDAERYRWLRERDVERGVCILDVGEWVMPASCIALNFHSSEAVDCAIDTAMQKD